ncbi:hypothetical protein ACROYT_G012652 [Oculina patagonica]
MDEESTQGTRPSANLKEEQTNDEKSNRKVRVFIPLQTENANPPMPLNHMESYIQFMARQELMANKIEKFDNRPKNYRTWKALFENMVRDVDIIASETLTMLMEYRYTTNQSKRLVQRLRNANVENPEEGLKEAWKKLSEQFGSNAVVTQMHLYKLTMFPKINSRDNKGLQELGDLLLELECAKNDGGLSGLKVLDEPAFVKPLLVKLPDDLQGRWQRHAYRYKVQKAADYPPFSEFAKFIQEISQERNDPYLAIENLDTRNLRSSRIPFKPPKPPNPDDKTREELLSTHDLILMKAIEISRAREAATLHMKALKSEEINKVKETSKHKKHMKHRDPAKGKPRQTEDPRTVSKKCLFCNQVHVMKKELCPAWEKSTHILWWKEPFFCFKKV